MKRIFGTVMAIGAVTCASAWSKPLAEAKFDGKFVWMKLGTLPVGTTKSFANAKTIVVKIQFGKVVHLTPDKKGNVWFTMILADQGSDWKWHQTAGSGGLQHNHGMIPAGTYSVVIPVAGIPASVLKDKMQSISVGPAASGLAAPVPIDVIGISGSK